MPSELSEKAKNLSTRDVLSPKTSKHNHIRNLGYNYQFYDAESLLKTLIHQEGFYNVYDEICNNLLSLARTKANEQTIHYEEMVQRDEFELLIEELKATSKKRKLRREEEWLIRLLIICLSIIKFRIIPSQVETNKSLGNVEFVELVDRGLFEKFIENKENNNKRYRKYSFQSASIILTNKLLAMKKSLVEEGVTLELAPTAIYALYDVVESLEKRDLESVFKTLRQYLIDIGKPQLESLITNTLIMSINSKDDTYRLAVLAFKVTTGDEKDLNVLKMEIASTQEKQY